MRLTSILVFVIAGAIASVSLAAPMKDRVFARGSAAGPGANATAMGEVKRPHTLRVVVRATPIQVVEVSGNVNCVSADYSRGNGTNYDFKGRAPLKRPLRITIAAPGSCTVFAIASVGAGHRGSITIELHTT